MTQLKAAKNQRATKKNTRNSVVGLSSNCSNYYQAIPRSIHLTHRNTGIHLCLALSVKFISVCGQRKVGGKALRNIVHTKVTYLFLTISQAFKFCSSRNKKNNACIYLYTIHMYIYNILRENWTDRPTTTKTIVSKTKTTTRKAAVFFDRELATGSWN